MNLKVTTHWRRGDSLRELVQQSGTRFRR